MWLIITLLVWTTIYNAETEAKRDFVMELHEYRFNTTKTNYVKTLKYNLYAQKYITIKFSLKRTLNDIELHLIFDMVKKDNKRVNVMNIIIDGYKGLEATYTTPLLVLITKEIFRKGNFPKKCPLKADELFYIRNFTFNEEYFPNFTPIMAFQTITEFYAEKQYQGYLTVRGRIRKK